MNTSYRDIRAMLERIPHIAAREALVATTVTAVGSGAMKQQAADEQVRRWRRHLPQPAPATEDQMTAFSAGIRKR